MITLIKISYDVVVVVVAGILDILIYFPSRRPAIVRAPLRGFDANLHSGLMEAKKTTTGAKRKKKKKKVKKTTATTRRPRKRC